MRFLFSVTIVTIVTFVTIVTEPTPAAGALVGARTAPHSLVAQLALEAGRGRDWSGGRCRRGRGRAGRGHVGRDSLKGAWEAPCGAGAG